jgi:hypothetical protein
VEGTPGRKNKKKKRGERERGNEKKNAQNPLCLGFSSYSHRKEKNYGGFRL